MKPIQFVLLLRFAEQKRTNPLSSQVLETLGGKIPEKRQSPDVPMEGMELKVNAKKATINWDTNSCLVRIEELSNEERTIETVLSFVDRINKIAPIEKIAMREFTVNWILPAPKHDFASLEKFYRANMIAKNEISDLAYDSSTVIDIKVDKYSIHLQSGAMEIQQLMQQYLRFKTEDIAKTFIFLETSVKEKNMIQYSMRDTSKFIKYSLECAISYSKLFENIWKGSL